MSHRFSLSATTLRLLGVTLGALPLFLSPLQLSAADQKASAAIQQLKETAKGFSAIAKEAIPAVVFIKVQKEADEQDEAPQEDTDNSLQDDLLRRFFGLPPRNNPESKSNQQILGQASGLIVSPDGYILTNNHAVSNANKIEVLLHDGRTFDAEIIGTDPQTDLAVIKIKADNLPYLTLGNSDAMEVGEWVIAVGNPFGLEATVTVGVVSAKGRNDLHITDFEDFIQTDAAINPGSSGGPLLNLDGDVIGINTVIGTTSGGYMGISFAIPSNMAKHIMDQLIKTGTVVRGFLGVSLQPLDPSLAQFFNLNSTAGAVVNEVVQGAAADQAGIKQGDVILKYNDTPVDSPNTLRNAVSLMNPGASLTLTVDREGKILTFNTVIGAKAPNPMKSNEVTTKIGLEIDQLTPEIAAQLGYYSESGVLIRKVEQGSPAADMGIRPGSLILSVNRVKVTSPDEFYKQLDEAAKTKKLLFLVRQGEVLRFVSFILN